MSTEHPSAFFTLPGADVGDGSGEGVRCPDQDGRGIVRSHRKKTCRPAGGVLDAAAETGRDGAALSDNAVHRSVGRPAGEGAAVAGRPRPTDRRTQDRDRRPGADPHRYSEYPWTRTEPPVDGTDMVRNRGIQRRDQTALLPARRPVRIPSIALAADTACMLVPL